ncbi:MAG: cyanophycinase [Saprospiraceae bacterium]|nr:cyanophycinase [Saprospiraceae bacterium]
MRKNQLILILLLAFTFLFQTFTSAKVLRVEIESREPVLNGKKFGQFGAYELLRGKIYYGFDPNNRYNQRITDLAFAPVNADGLVEAWGDLVVLQAVDANKRRGVALVEVSNRGGKFTPSYFNQATKTRALQIDDPAYWGDGLTMEEGLTVIWIGWQFDVPAHEHTLNFHIPKARGKEGQSIEGWVRSDWSVEKPSTTLHLGHNGQIPYPAIRPDSREHQLTVRDGRDAPRLPIPRSDWSFGDDRQHIELTSGFQAGKIYELVYRAADPVVVGLGPAAIRDVISYAKHDESCPFSVQKGVAAGVSQTGRFLRYFLYKGFNTDEEGRPAYDGIMSITAGGGKGSFNHRFAQPSRDAHRYSAFFYPTDIFPFALQSQRDKLNGETDGILDQLFDPTHVPKVFQINTGYEYWGRSASLIHTSPDGQKDLELLPTERIYHLASGQHFVDRWPPNNPYGAGPLDAYRGDPLEFRVNYRALLIGLVNWVDQNVEPPASKYPRLSDGTLVPKEAVDFPQLANIDFPTTIHQAYRVDYGGRWDRGIIDQQPPKLGYTFPSLVPQVDSLGNEVGGIRNVEIRVPIGTYTPWSLRLGAAANKHELANFRGLFIPLTKTEAERQEKADPRPNLHQLYPDEKQYMEQVEQAINELIGGHYLLKRDRAFLKASAQARWEWAQQERPTQTMVSEGPKNGALIIIGGGRLDKVFYQKFKELAGGADAPIVIIPTANSDFGLNRDSGYVNTKSRFLAEGFKQVTVLHTRNREEANSAAFTQAIREAKGVWFPGGRQWRLADSYLNTETHEALKDLLDRGGVIAGSSAGATIQGSYLARGDSKTNTIMMGDHEEGLGFVTNIAIDQHLLARNRQFDLFEILEHRPELLGIGLDENTGIVVQGDQFEVIGASLVAIYDGKKWSRERRAYFPLGKGEKRFYFLRSGARYDLRHRKVIE